MKFSVLGATGESGKYLIEQALADGHQVIALVRNPDKITTTHDNLEVQVVNIFSSESLSKGFTGCDAVVSCLGPPITIGTVFREVYICQDSMKCITAAMRTAGISRIICMSSACTKNNSNNPKHMEWLFKPLFAGRMFKDLAVMEKFLIAKCQDLNFTVIKPPQLENRSLVEEELIAIEGDYSSDYKLTIPRPNVTRFMMDCLKDDTWRNKLVTLGLKR